MRILWRPLGIVLALALLWATAFPLIFHLDQPRHTYVSESVFWTAPLDRSFDDGWAGYWNPTPVQSYGIMQRAKWRDYVWWPLCRGWAKWKGWDP